MEKEKSHYWMPCSAIIVGVLIAFGKISSIPEIRLISNILICTLTSFAGFSFGIICAVVVYRSETARKGFMKKSFELLFPASIGSIVFGLVSACLLGMGSILGIIVGTLIFLILTGLLLILRRRTKRQSLPK